MKRYEAGSEFRIWDLHVHTPASIVHHFSGRPESVWEQYFEELRNLPTDIKVLGINDYIFIDGYERVLSEFKKGNLPNIELLLPVIELRVNRFGGSKSKLSRVNFHVIFSNTVSADIIQAQFLNCLPGAFQLLPRYQDRADWSGGVPTRASLTDLGQRIIESAPADQQENYDSPLIEGFNNLTVNLDEVRKLLQKQYFRKTTMTAVGKTEWEDIKWADGSIADKKDIINGADWVFTAAASPEHYRAAQRKLAEANVNSRLLDCSDAHYFTDSTDKDRLGNCNTWIKADPTFEGLRIAHREFSDRVWVGKEPPKHKERRLYKSRFFSKITLFRDSQASLTEKWFDNTSVQLNSDLVAIIGSKGSGKSALAECIALLSNAGDTKDYSFLCDKRFRRGGQNLSKKFRGRLHWCCGNQEEKSLADNPSPTAIPRAVVLPQNFIELICNELDGVTFQREIENVIFSHIPDHAKSGTDDLRQLQERVGASLQDQLDANREKISKINAAIEDLEEKASPEYQARLKSEFEQRWKELRQITQERPTAVPAPSENSQLDAEQKAAGADHSRIAERLAEVESALSTHQDELARSTRILGLIGEVEQRLSVVERAIQNCREELRPTLMELGLEFHDLVKVEINVSLLKGRQTEQQEAAEVSRSALDTDVSNSVAAEREALVSQKVSLRMKLDEPTRLYEAYLAEYAEWKSRKREIVGSKDTPGSALYFRAKLREASRATIELDDLRNQRKEIVNTLIATLREISDEHQKLFAPVQQHISGHHLTRDHYKLNFRSALEAVGLDESLLALVNLAKAGTFNSSEGAVSALNRLKGSYSPTDSPLEFAEEVEKAFRFDSRDEAKLLPRKISDQLKRGFTPRDLYDFLYQFKYLEPRYSIELDEKPLALLSPGEKGALLLIFFLLVDRRREPLIIDQPEENLDNQTVYELLVPAIKEAKKWRQIIMVTHNPNLAIVCDAEQVIHARKDPGDGNRITYTAGSIESPAINPLLVNVLEGTFPAFRNRDSKYQRQEARSG